MPPVPDGMVSVDETAVKGGPAPADAGLRRVEDAEGMEAVSHIVKMVICTYFEEDRAMAQLNQWCRENDGRGQQFEQLGTETAGGTKVYTGQVWAMAGNYFPHEKLAEAFPTFDWLFPVVLVAYSPDHEGVEIYRGG